MLQSGVYDICATDVYSPASIGVNLSDIHAMEGEIFILVLMNFTKGASW